MRTRSAVLVLFAGLIAAGSAGPQTPGRFYDVDKEVRFEGTVREIVLEPRYKGTAPFLVLRIEEPGSAARTDVEVSPSWFFREDIHGGEKIKGIGSLSEGPEGRRTIIARELQLRGEILTLRDKRGFPNWQGGPRGRRGPRRLGSD
ncbi:MAG: hypothetical protein KA243_07680 [Candidatus Aminicenantes bacterium]|jgi:hypothetical protein|nr:hypothetical protein [Candidatus Aminicenantes bacterium]NLH77538.1 hypothetical protein [Acidobacteriota bacterium]